MKKTNIITFDIKFSNVDLARFLVVLWHPVVVLKHITKRGYPHCVLKNNLTQERKLTIYKILKCKIRIQVYTEYNMDGRQVVIKKSEEINYIDHFIMNDLCHGLNIYIVNAKHLRTCKGNKELFNKVIHNNDPMVRVIFIKDILKHEFKIMENTYYHESRRSRHPCPQDPLEKFIWQCPVCGLEFDNM